ncbi:MAG: thiamine pyrophosphate-binding protein [Cyanobacteria bacterium]|nr:thiamine pyrophosphate-binding protein [Cyanobacteriota bacterium]
MTSAATKQLTVHIILEQLKAEGVRFVFAGSSSSESPITASLHAGKKNEELQLVTAIHESSAVFMAMGYAQATSLPAVVNVAAGQGLLNAAPAIYAAHRNQIPLVILADQEDAHILNDDPPLNLDQVSAAKPLCKWSSEARTAREICRLLRRAFHEALTPPKGPVVVSIPINLLLSSAKSEVVRPPLTSPLGPADENFIAKVVHNIVKAKNPCLIVGNEVAQYRARKDVVLLCEVMGCPVYVEPMPTGVNFPNRHPHFAGVLPLNTQEANDWLKDHDVTVALGVQTRLPNRTDGPALIPDSGVVIQINMDGHLAGRSLKSTMATQADISETLSRIRAEIQLAVDTEWINECKQRARRTVGVAAARRERLDGNLTFPDPDRPTSLFWLLKILDGARPEKSVVVSDIIHDNITPPEILGLESGSSFFSSNSGVGGYALSAGLGIQWSSGLPVIALMGDESFLTYPQALWTAAHYKLNLKIVVANSRGKHRLNVLPSAPTRRLPRWPLSNPAISISRLADSMNIPAIHVPNYSDLESALSKLFADDGPGLLDVEIDLT